MATDVQVIVQDESKHVVVEDTEAFVVLLTTDQQVVVEEQVTQVVSVGEQGPTGAQGPIGLTGPSGGATTEVNFAYGDASPTMLATAVAGKLVYGVGLHIKVPFDGIGATLTVGDAGQADRLMAAGENDVTQVGSNATAPAYVYGVNTAITLSIAPGAGASQGSGTVVLYIQA